MNEDSNCSDKWYKRAQAFLEKVLQVKKNEGYSKEVLELLQDTQFMQEVDFFFKVSAEDALPVPFDDINFIALCLKETDKFFNKESIGIFFPSKERVWKPLDIFLARCKKKLQIRENERKVLQWLDSISAGKAYQPEYVEIHSATPEDCKEAWQSVHNNRSTGNFSAEDGFSEVASTVYPEDSASAKIRGVR